MCIYILLIGVLIIRCNEPRESRKQCNQNFQRQLGMIGLVDWAIPRNNPDDSEEELERKKQEARHDLWALFAISWSLCVDEAPTDHVDPNIPLAPIWDRL